MRQEYVSVWAKVGDHDERNGSASIGVLIAIEAAAVPE